MSQLSQGLKTLGGLIPHQTAAERRMKADAISSYYQQKEAALAEQSRLNQAKDAETRRLQEKQIRAMRRRYRSSGFMQPMTDSGLSDKLG